MFYLVILAEIVSHAQTIPLQGGGSEYKELHNNAIAVHKYRVSQYLFFTCWGLKKNRG